MSTSKYAPGKSAGTLSFKPCQLGFLLPFNVSMPDVGLSIPDNEKEIFDVMKYEVNRYNSFMGRWPLRYVKPKDLAKNSFFYLLFEDRVQCAFCNIIIDDWNVGETPLKKHMKKAPKCPFLMASNVGNIPMQKQKPIEKSLSRLIPNTKSNSTSLSGQAKNPEQHSTHHNLEEEKTSSTHSLAQSEMIRHACDMFLSSLVQKVVTHHLNITGGHFIYFHHLCEAILDYKDREPAKSNCEVLSSENSAADENVNGLKRYL
ncbi:baculoviral IAP repeat-containing protein 7-A [Caerostris extrusa]|uniref:Baculoviral IAP repeat-containing protein 7-A n=1 Tax=Caerostris extrusa TaxID=172846 RepID=A0AAV4NIG9_CAEEX|nr:baculoviral IAP repeat-containing protein 7-A [Caerostris extrusa]